MELRFWNDPETGLPHIYAHGVTEEEVRQVLSWPRLEYPEERDARVRLGQTAAGRYLKVVYVACSGLGNTFENQRGTIKEVQCDCAAPL